MTKQLKFLNLNGEPNVGGRTALKVWEITGTSIVAHIVGGQFRKRILAYSLCYQNPCGASIFLCARPNFGGKNEKLNFQAKIGRLSPP